MKKLKYRICTEINHGTPENPDIEQQISEPFYMDWSEVNEEIVKGCAYNGEYTIEDDGQPEPDPTPDERIAVLEEQIAQADETAIYLYESQEAQEAINAQQDEALMEIYEMIG